MLFYWGEPKWAPHIHDIAIAIYICKLLGYECTDRQNSCKQAKLEDL